MITLYGIKNCETVKKARRWLQSRGVAYRFHDYREHGLSAMQLRAWVRELGWEALLNTRGTTWRRLPDALKENVTESKAIEIMLAHPAVIKRPLLDLGKRRLLLGFDETDYGRCLSG